MAVAAGDRVCLVLKRLLGLRRTGARGKTMTAVIAHCPILTR
jgi:hypothetical protein